MSKNPVNSPPFASGAAPAAAISGAEGGPFGGVDDWTAPLRGGPPVLITGAAGFIGFHLALRLLEAGIAVCGVDALTSYYDVGLKRARLAVLSRRAGFTFHEIDIADAGAVEEVFARCAPRHVVNLAAQAGVRYSIVNPHAYGAANLTGFLNILEAARRASLAHLVYASSSAVYGGNARLPFSVAHGVDHPISLYAATKKANELMAHAYSHLYGLPATGLRFFTVYGPWGRPDMAYWRFADAIAEGRQIELYNNGDMGRDFTYVDDVVEPLTRLIGAPARPDPDFDPMAPSPGSSWAPHRVYNIGADRPERLTDLVGILEEALGRKAEIALRPMQPGDVKETWADVEDLAAATGCRPQVDLRSGLTRFVAWRRGWRNGDYSTTAE